MAGPPNHDIDPSVFASLLAGLEGGHAAVCLCDADDQVRYVNPAFRTAFFGNATETPFDFTEGLANAIAAGVGIKLESMSVAEFVPRVRARRRTGPVRYDFTLDLVDGTWWWVNDHRLPNGWMLVVATEISPLKQEEFRLREAHSAAVKENQIDALTGTRSRNTVWLRRSWIWIDIARTVIRSQSQSSTSIISSKSTTPTGISRVTRC